MDTKPKSKLETVFFFRRKNNLKSGPLWPQFYARIGFILPFYLHEQDLHKYIEIISGSSLSPSLSSKFLMSSSHNDVNEVDFSISRRPNVIVLLSNIYTRLIQHLALNILPSSYHYNHTARLRSHIKYPYKIVSHILSIENIAFRNF